MSKCLAAQPEAVIVDLGQCQVEDPAALAVFSVAARDAAQWPGAPLLFCRPNAQTAAVLSRSALCRYVPVFPTLEAAIAGIGDQMVPVQLSTHLMPAVGAARQARELVTEACARWELPALVGPACTIVTELVNNVVVHAQTPMDVVLRLRERYLNISVRDGSPMPPRALESVAPTAPGGRGLMMVAAVAKRWGYTPVTDGKVVWAVLRTDDHGPLTP
jgi:hypothetical protein